MDIDKNNRPIDQLLPNLFQKFKRCPIFTISEADRNLGLTRESVETMTQERINEIRTKVREKISQHYYSIEDIDTPEKLQRIRKARRYDQVPHIDGNQDGM